MAQHSRREVPAMACVCESEIKAAYKIGELERMSRISRHILHRMFVRDELPIFGTKRRPMVLLAGFRAKYPQLWDSIVERLALAQQMSHLFIEYCARYAR
jgi:hypothetical protein